MVRVPPQQIKASKVAMPPDSSLTSQPKGKEFAYVFLTEIDQSRLCVIA